MEREAFQPIAVASPATSPFVFRFRCLVDLQLATIVQHLRPAVGKLTGSVLDVGAGHSPWRGWLSRGTVYQGIDVAYASDFGMQLQTKDVVYYAGGVMPFPDNAYEAVLCIEVLEHSKNPSQLLEEIARVMKHGGTLLMTVPWSARRHHIPHDYQRFTREGLASLLDQTGFDAVEILERGNDIAVIANKLTVLTFRLIAPRKFVHCLVTWPLALLCGSIALAFIVAAHISIAFGAGAKEDPLGYFVRAKKAATAA
jgi:SAM-dependent methyltransferase